MDRTDRGCTSESCTMRVAYVLVDLNGQVGIVVDIPPEVYALVGLVLHLANCLYAEYGGGLRHPLRA